MGQLLCASPHRPVPLTASLRRPVPRAPLSRGREAGVPRPGSHPGSPRTQWDSWANPVSSVGPGFSLCKLRAGVAGEGVLEGSFQDRVERDNPNHAKIAKEQEGGSHLGPHLGAGRAEAEAICLRSWGSSSGGGPAPSSVGESHQYPPQPSPMKSYVGVGRPGASEQSGCGYQQRGLGKAQLRHPGTL